MTKEQKEIRKHIIQRLSTRERKRRAAKKRWDLIRQESMPGTNDEMVYESAGNADHDLDGLPESFV